MGRWAALRGMEGITVGLGPLAPVGRLVGVDRTELRLAAMGLAFILLVLSLVDLAVTYVIVGGLGGVEVNPLMAPLIGTPWALAAKIGVPVVVFVLSSRVESAWTVYALRATVLVYLVVVAFGLAQVGFRIA